MSRGPGRIERVIRELFDAHPDEAFTTDNLCLACYPGLSRWRVENKHQVAVLRAAHKLVAADPNWRAERSRTAGRGWVFFNHDSVQSYARHRLLTQWPPWPHPDVDAALQQAGHRDLMGEGGAWHRFVEQHRAERDGDTARVAALEAEGRADLARVMARSRLSVARMNTGVGNPTLTALAAKARALMTQNDPDAIRAGLAEIADALDPPSEGTRNAA